VDHCPPLPPASPKEGQRQKLHHRFHHEPLSNHNGHSAPPHLLPQPELPHPTCHHYQQQHHPERNRFEVHQRALGISLVSFLNQAINKVIPCHPFSTSQKCCFGFCLCFCFLLLVLSVCLELLQERGHCSGGCRCSPLPLPRLYNGANGNAPHRCLLQPHSEVGTTVRTVRATRTRLHL
jgi:hypothetical protein